MTKALEEIKYWVKRHERAVWFGIIAAAISLVSLFLNLKGCGKVEKETEIVEAKKAPCGESLDGDIQTISCAEGLTGEVVKICKDGDWVIAASNCRVIVKEDPDPKPDPDPECSGCSDPVWADIKVMATKNHCFDSGCHSDWVDSDKAEDNQLRWNQRIDKIIQFVNVDTMPAGGYDPLKPEEKQLIIDYRDSGMKLEKPACCGGGEGNGGGEEARETFDSDDVDRWIKNWQDDPNQSQVTAGNTRFLSCLTQYNLGKDMDRCGKVSEHMVNLISNVSSLVVLKPIDARKIVWAWDLRDSGHDRLDWQNIQIVDPVGFESQSDLAEETRENCNLDVVENSCWLPMELFSQVVHGDQNPELYATLVNDIENTFIDTINNLGCDFQTQINSFAYNQAGFNGSILTQDKPRTIIAFECAGKNVHITLDHAVTADETNIFKNPFLPVGFYSVQNIIDIVEGRQVDFDAGEMIYFADNGYMRFMLFNAQGIRQVEAPTNIVRNPDDPHGAGVIYAAPASCMQCHWDAMIFYEDQVRDTVQVDGDQQRIIDRSYKGLEAQINRNDKETYATLLAGNGYPQESPDIVYQSRVEWVANWKIDRFCAHFGQRVEECISRIQQDQFLRENFGSLLVNGGVVSHDEIEDQYENIAIAFGLGRAEI